MSINVVKSENGFNSYYVYKADGFFSSDAEAQAYMDKYAGKDGYPFGSQKFKAGDLIYKDANGDGIKLRPMTVFWLDRLIRLLHLH